MFIVPTSAPGYKITPIWTMGNVRTNATYYEDVRIPASDLVGQENGGWWLITTQLNHERIALSAVGFVDRIYQDVLAWARETGVIQRPWVQTHLARVLAKLEVLKLLNWQQAWSMARGALNFAEASAVSRTWGDCYGYLLVATGRAEVMVDGIVSPWDSAALFPLITEAGGTFTDWAGSPTAFGANVIATNAAVGARARELLGAGAVRDR